MPQAVLINAKSINPKSSELIRLIKSMEKLQAMADWFKEIWPSHGAFPADPGLIDQLLEGARSITAGQVQGSKTEHRGTKVVKYIFPYAGFICDIK